MAQTGIFGRRYVQFSGFSKCSVVSKIISFVVHRQGSVLAFNPFNCVGRVISFCLNSSITLVEIKLFSMRERVATLSICHAVNIIQCNEGNPLNDPQQFCMKGGSKQWTAFGDKWLCVFTEALFGVLEHSNCWFILLSCISFLKSNLHCVILPLSLSLSLPPSLFFLPLLHPFLHYSFLTLFLFLPFFLTLSISPCLQM